MNVIQLIRDAGPYGWPLVVGVALVYVLLATPLRRYAPAIAAVLVVGALQSARFVDDGRPMPVFDMTSFHFARAVCMRVLAGASLLLLAPPIGTAASAYVGGRLAAAFGFVVFAPLGAGLLGSALTLITALRAVGAEGGAERGAVLIAAFENSTRMLTLGGGLTVLAACACAYELFRRIRRSRARRPYSAEHSPEGSAQPKVMR